MLEERRLLSVSIEQFGGEPLKASTDIHISALAGDETEPQIAIDPSNPARMFASADYGLHGNGLFAAYSNDAGATWLRTDADGRIAQGGSSDLPLACCNSSVAFDRFGNLYLTYLEANTGRTVLAISTDGGQSFGPAVRRFSGTHGDTDQPTVITGPGSNGAAASVWILYINHHVDPITRIDTENMAVHGAAVNGPGIANIGAFSAVQLTPDVAGIEENFGDASVGPAGQLLVAFQDDISANGPVMLYATLDADGLGSGGFSTPIAITSTNAGGEDAIPAQPDMKIDSGIGLAYDTSQGQHRGRVYMVYSDETINESDDIDTWVRYSDDDGATWSAGVKVNDDQTNRSQFLPRIAVDPQSGAVGISWYDARNDSGSGSGDTDGVANTNAQIFAAISVDGAASFGSNVQVSDGTSFHRVGWKLDYGGYSGLAFFGGTLYPTWADNSASLDNFEVYTDRVVVATLMKINEDGANDVVNASPVADHFLKIVDEDGIRYVTGVGTSVDVQGGLVNLSGTQRLAGLNIDAGTVTVNGVLVTDSLTMTKEMGNYSGRLDLTDGDLILNMPSTAAAENALVALSDLVASGRNSGAYWMGNGISSSVAAANVDRDTGLALIRNSDDGTHALKSVFAGHLVDANSILLGYTWNGDADIDGDVDADDYARIDAGYSARLSDYRNGDFNYSGGGPNADDYFLIDKAFSDQDVVLGPAQVALSSAGSVQEPARARGREVRARAPKRRMNRSHLMGWAPQTQVVPQNGSGRAISILSRLFSILLPPSRPAPPRPWSLPSSPQSWSSPLPPSSRSSPDSPCNSSFPSPPTRVSASS